MKKLFAIALLFLICFEVFAKADTSIYVKKNPYHSFKSKIDTTNVFTISTSLTAPLLSQYFFECYFKPKKTNLAIGISYGYGTKVFNYLNTNFIPIPNKINGNIKRTALAVYYDLNSLGTSNSENLHAGVYLKYEWRKTRTDGHWEDYAVNSDSKEHHDSLAQFDSKKSFLFGVWIEQYFFGKSFSIRFEGGLGSCSEVEQREVFASYKHSPTMIEYYNPSIIQNIDYSQNGLNINLGLSICYHFYANPK